MERLRSSPRLPQAVREAETITFVCHGNIIRSVYAEHLLKGRAEDRLRLQVRSAGVAAIPGRPADPRAVRLGLDRGVDLRRHRATPVDALSPRPGELVLAMEVSHLRAFRNARWRGSAHVLLLGCLERGGDVEIPDPYGAAEIAEFARCFDRIDSAVEELGRLLSDGDSAGS